MSKTTPLTLEACGHTIKVRDWGWSPDTKARIELTLDGFCLAVVGEKDAQLMLGIAEKLAYALRAPERKKKPKLARQSV